MVQKKQTSIKKRKTVVKTVEDFLTKTGFILEMEVSEVLKKDGYSVKVNRYFYDYDENKKREIDIIATKKINGINVILVIECKQSLLDDWIFICSEDAPSRYYNFLKHLPEIKKIKESKIFDHLHTLDNSVSLAQNYIIKNVTNKKSTSIQIDQCIEKLPKVVVDVAYSDVDEKYTRTLLIPTAVFSGQIFTANYKKKLLVKEVDLVQYQIDLESDGYKYHYRKLSSRYNLAIASVAFGNDAKNKNDEIQNSEVASISRKLGEYYLVDFITKKGLDSFLDSIEKEVKKIDVKLWPVGIKE